MSKIIHLEDLLQSGLIRADAHFEKLRDCAMASLPEFLWQDLPAKRTDMGGLFTASSTAVYLYLLKGMEDYYHIQANFKYDNAEWKFENFCIGFGMLGAGAVYCDTIEDAVVMSREAKKIKNQFMTSLEHPSTASTVQ